jgi:hypothetical protein
MRWRGFQGDPMNGSGAWTDGRFFERRVEEREDSDEAVLGGSGTVFFLGFDWYRYQIETMRGRRRTEKDRARETPEVLAAPEKSGEEAKKKKKKIITVIQNLCSDTMLRIRLYIESHIKLYMRGLFI